MHDGLELLVAIPIAVGLLHDDVALEQQPFEYLLDIESGVLCIAHTKCHVLEVAEQCHVLDLRLGAHRHALLRRLANIVS